MNQASDLLAQVLSTPIEEVAAADLSGYGSEYRNRSVAGKPIYVPLVWRWKTARGLDKAVAEATPALNRQTATAVKRVQALTVAFVGRLPMLPMVVADSFAGIRR